MNDSMGAGFVCGMAAALGLAPLQSKEPYQYDPAPAALLREAPRDRMRQRARQARLKARRRR